MDRITIKQNAQKMIKGNIWYIWKPMVWLMIACFALSLIGGILDGIADTEIFSSIMSIVVSIVSAPITVGYSFYCLGFVRGQKMDAKEVFNFAKEHWLIAILVSILAGLNIMIGMILLVIPGIIAALGLTFYSYVAADNPELSASEILRKTWEITKGYKWDLFIFFLSFLGWVILAPFTLCILYIWLIPYMTIAEVLVYESLKK